MKCIGMPAPLVRTRDGGLSLQFVALLLSQTAASLSLDALIIYLLCFPSRCGSFRCFAKPHSFFNYYSFPLAHSFHHPSYFCSAEPNAKPAEGGIAGLATALDPSTPRPEGLQATAGAVNGFASPSEKTPPAPQALGPAAPPSPAPQVAPVESPASQQDGPHPQEPAAFSPDTARQDPPEEHQASAATNGAFSDSAESSVLTPSSLTDLDLQEATLDASSGTEPEKIGPASSGVSVGTEESLVASVDGVSQKRESKLLESETGKSSDMTTSHQSEMTQKRGKEPKLIIVKTLCRDEVVTHRHLDAKCDEGIAGGDNPDGLQAEDPLASEGEKAEPKKRHSLLKRNKKSNQGNVLHINEAHLWKASLPGSPSAILICTTFVAFYLMSHVILYW